MNDLFEKLCAAQYTPHGCVIDSVLGYCFTQNMIFNYGQRQTFEIKRRRTRINQHIEQIETVILLALIRVYDLI